MLLFSGVIGMLIWRVVQLNRTLRTAEQDPDQNPGGNGNGKYQVGAATPPPWAGAMDAKTTVFVFPSLVVSDSSKVERRYRLSFGDFSIGRAGDNELVIPRPEVAPHHARISLDGSGFMIEDLGSHDGTAVNGERVGSRRLLQNMDRVQIGSTVITFTTV